MKQPNKQYEVLKWASLFLESHHREPRVAEILLQHYLNVSQSAFYAMMREPVSESVLQSFETAINQHAVSGIPVQHLMGYEMFYSRKFLVNEHVLIPRPETEELVQHVIGLADNKSFTIVDVGTGSGIIAITLALELPQATIYATDISKKALDVARKNAQQQKAAVTFLEGDFLQPLIDEGIQADIIVSNPPYISREDEESLSDTVKNFDPELALFAADEGLAAYSQIIEQSRHTVNPHAKLAFEIGDTQSEVVRSLIKKYYTKGVVQTIGDINGKDRIVSAQI